MSVRSLLTDEGGEALAAATTEADPDSLAAATRLRRRFAPELAASALAQVTLRRRAVRKFGDAAEAMLFTPDGLEQATRPVVADLRARRLVAAGVREVVDLGCGIGADAAACVRAGLEVIAVERDPDTAAAARFNLALAGGGEVVVADAETVALPDHAAVLLDPARRGAAGRLWRVEDFTPSWSLVERHLGSRRPTVVKLGPALPHRLVPPGVEAEWVSDRGDVVEVTLRNGPAGGVEGLAARLTTGETLRPGPAADVAPIGAWLHEPDGAAIRAGALGRLAHDVGAALVDPQIAYLTSDHALISPWLTSFRVLEVLAWEPRLVRRWLTERGIGTLEVKKRGVDVDPAEVRRRLRPRGPGAATLLLTRTPQGARAVLAERP